MIDQIEAESLIDCGVEHLGFPLVLGYHDEDLSIDEAAAIVTALGERATFFLITYLDKALEIVDLCRTLRVAKVQLHGEISAGELRRLREAWPDLRIIKSLIVRSNNLEALQAEVIEYAPLVDAFITDTFDPDTGASGATGKTHDWSVSRRLVEISPLPVILAGGLDADNVRDAIQAVRPAGVDVHTGIEASDGRKDATLARRFVSEVRAGFASLVEG